MALEMIKTNPTILWEGGCGCLILVLPKEKRVLSYKDCSTVQRRKASGFPSMSGAQIARGRATALMGAHREVEGTARQRVFEREGTKAVPHFQPPGEDGAGS